MLQRKEYNITKARRCDIECCAEDKCNDGAEVDGDMSFISSFVSYLSVITSAIAGFFLGNN